MHPLPRLSFACMDFSPDCRQIVVIALVIVTTVLNPCDQVGALRFAFNEGAAPPIQIGSLQVDFPPDSSTEAPLVNTISNVSRTWSRTIALSVVFPTVFLLGVPFCCWLFCLWKDRRRRMPRPATTVQNGVLQEQDLQQISAHPSFVQSPVPDGPQVHIFISHTGGEHGIEKNFAKSVGEKLEENPCYRVFIDCKMRMGVDFPKEISQEIQMTELAIVVVTRDYFARKWPMLELVEFLKLYNVNREAPTVRVLPLFYKLTPEQVRELLDQDYWQSAWTQMSIEGRRHNFSDVETYREVVAALCRLSGVKYNYTDLAHDQEYIKTILEKVKNIHIDMRKKSQSGSARV